MGSSMFASMLVDTINTYYGEKTVYLKRFKCYTFNGDIEIGYWGLREWASRISTNREIGDISEFYRPSD